LGTKYGGFQINESQRTIQAEIEMALYRAGMLTTLNYGIPQKYSWSSSARTDKGVHACAQLCSCKVELLESDLEGSNNLEVARLRLESYLPSDIRVLDLLRTTRNMCAKTQRDRVRYQYMIPAFMLHPNWHQVLKDQGIPLEGRKNVAKAPLSPEEIKKVKDVIEGYRSTEEQRKLLQSALEKYEGTNPFHNFTKGIKPGEAQANRFIEYFRVEDPVVFDGVEWIPTQVLGQSFLLNQIRKMVSMAIDIARGAAPLEILEKALSKIETVRVTTAPAQGLFLEMSFFGGYNRRKAQNQDLPDLDWSEEGPAKERWKAFRHTIRQHIVEEEKQQGNFIQYMYVQECIFDYRKFYNLEGDASKDSKNEVTENDKPEE
jgi:tRNA pseudouridine38-40 synthase